MRFSSLGGALIGLVAISLFACGDDETSGGTPDPGTDGGPVPTVDGGDPPNPMDAAPPCDLSTVKNGFDGSKSITVSGVKRTYQLFVPPSCDATKALPIVFVLHGDGGTGAGIRGSFRLEAEAAGGAIFVYPDGLNNTWIIDNGPGLLKDVSFIDAVVGDAGKTRPVDTKRVFAVGFSKGAYFANMLGCVSKSGIRAVVAHSGGGPFYLDGIGTTYDNSAQDVVCPAAPPATLQIIGDADGLLGDAKKARDHWERVNACKSTSQAFAPSPCIAYDGCAAGRPEIYCEIPGLGHQVWSSATKATWAFLKTK